MLCVLLRINAHVSYSLKNDSFIVCKMLANIFVCVKCLNCLDYVVFIESRKLKRWKYRFVSGCQMFENRIYGELIERLIIQVFCHPYRVDHIGDIYQGRCPLAFFCNAFSVYLIDVYRVNTRIKTGKNVYGKRAKTRFRPYIFVTLSAYI
jgi:hypothetical protein